MTHSKSKIQNPKLSLPRYPRYKDSGVEWLGEIPEHWTAEKGKWLFVKMDRTVRPDDDVVTAFRDGQVTLRTNRRTEGFTNAIKEHGYQGIRKGDLVIHAMDAFAGAIGVSESDGKSTPVYSACVPRKPNTVTPELYAYLLRYMAHSGFITTLAKGIRERSTDFRFNDFGALELPLPPKPEQDRIVAFLDQKTAEIDTLIAKKQRQIELLDEQKAILINRAVTRGLNPNAKLKPSGIQWIGEIPEEWQVKKLKYLINIQAGYAFKSSAYSQKDTDIRLLRGINVNPGQINWNDTVYWPHDKLREVSDFMLDSDDMVMGMDRPWVGAGVRIARITETDLPALLLQRVARIRATGIEPDYLERTLTGPGFKAYFEPILTGVSVPHISPDQIACYVAAVPPKAEQTKICKFIKEAESLGAKTARAAEAQIESLKTLRSTLIAHAVTGRIKV